MGAPTRARWKRKKDKPLFIFVGVLFALLFSAIVAFFVWGAFATGKTLGPAQVVQALMERRLPFSGTYFVVLAVVVVAVAVLVVLFTIWSRKTIVRASWVDVAAQHMASPKEAASLSRKAVMKKAKALKVEGAGK